MNLERHSFTTIYLRFRVEESGLSALCGLPEHNHHGLELLASWIEAEFRLASIPCGTLFYFGPLNSGNLHFATSQPFSALRCLRRILEKCRLFQLATIHWYDPAEDYDRPFNHAAGVDPATPFDLLEYNRQIHLHLAADRRRTLQINELMATLPQPLLPPISAP